MINPLERKFAIPIEIKIKMMKQQNDKYTRRKYVAVGMGFGITLGIALGAAIGNIALGLAVSILVGGVGSILGRKQSG